MTPDSRGGQSGKLPSHDRPESGSNLSPSLLLVDLDHFRARLLQDCLTEALAGYWLHRAQQFEDAAPRQGDWHGFAEHDHLLDQWERCKQTAENCRRHARLILDRRPEPIAADVLSVLDEVA